MKKLNLALLAGLSALMMSATATASEQECQKLKNQHNVIYAAKGFCFKDKEAKEKFNKNCFTSDPKFNEKEQQKLDEIKQRQKELNCK